MINKIKISAIILVCLLSLTSCGNENLEKVISEPSEKTFELVSDRNTGIIYISNDTYLEFKIYTPYYSKNGKLCRFEDGKIVEIEESEE